MESSKRRFRKELFLDSRTQISVVRRRLGKAVPMHLHDYFELEIVIAGSGEQNLNGTLYPLDPGAIYFLTPIDFHAVTPCPELTVLNVAFAENLLSADLQSALMNRRSDLIFSSAQDAAGMAALVSRLEDECRRSDSYAHTAREHLLELLVLPLLRQVPREDPPGTQSDRIQEAMQYLFQHFREDITLPELARRSGYSPNYFSHLFSQVCGVSFVEFLTRLRLGYARTALLTTQLSVTEVSQKSGFSSPSSFFRAFRRETGLSPRQYRQTHAPG